MQLGDALAVAGLIRRAFGAIEVPLDPRPSALRETESSVCAQLGTGGGAVWEEGAIVGCVLWREEAAALYLGRLAVHPEHVGRGIARGLLAAAEGEARRVGLQRLTLAVRLALPDNRRLFASAGFRETGLHAHAGYDAPTFADAEKLL